MRGIPFTPDMQTPERLKRFMAYTLSSQYMVFYSDSMRGFPGLTSQLSGAISRQPYYQRNMREIEEVALRICPEEWAICKAARHECSSLEEKDGYISWIHRSEKTRQAFIVWSKQVREEQAVGWLPVDNPASGH